MRKDRVASLLSREISQIVAREIKDPRLGFITITKVVMQNDLKVALVYFSSLGDKSEGLTILNHAKGYIRSNLAHRVRLKYIPQLEFRIDNSYEYGAHIDALIEEIHRDNKEEQ